jgi:hypothetical protein
MTFQTNFKPSRTVRKKAEHQRKLARKGHERQEMTAVRQRDRACRFPLCGCRTLKLRLEVAHTQHRGMGGNPAGDRTSTASCVLLCMHRHQFGAVSLHAGTLRHVPLTADGFDGPVAWEIYDDLGGWMEVAREDRIGHCELTPLQAQRLAELGEMDR